MTLADDVLAMYASRQARQEGLIDGMLKVRETYYGELKIDIPEVDGWTKPPIPNLLQQGVDQLAGRVISTQPMIQVLPNTMSRTERRRASTAEKVYSGWWTKDKVHQKLKRRARHYIAYGLTTSVLTWDFKNHRPHWEVRSPLATYPDPDMEHENVSPNNVIHVYAQTAKWMKDRGYGAHLAEISGGRDLPENHTIALLDYRDSRIQATVACAKDAFTGKSRAATLTFLEHGLEMTPATVACRTGLDVLSGQFDQMLSMYEMQGYLMALEVLATQRGIFPDTYLISRAGEIGRFIDGPHDGRTGKINIVAGGDVKSESISPGYMTNQVIDRLERNQRVTSRLPSEFGGESGSNIRTGRRGEALLASTIDMDVADAQNALSDCLAIENEIAARMAKKWDGDETRTIRVQEGTADKSVTYVANVVFSETDNTVAYPASGSDINQLIVGVGQRVGLGTMSKRTAAELDPYVQDAEVEHDRIIAEGLEEALLQGLQQQAATGTIPPLVLAKVMQLVEADKMELAEALNKVTEDAMKAQEEQAAAAQQQQQGAAPPMTPEMAMAGPAATAMTGNPQAMSTVPGLPQGASDLSSMLATLRMPTMGVTNRVGVEGAQ